MLAPDEAEYARKQAELIKKQFKEFDLNGDGSIDQDELKAIMFVLSPSLTEDGIAKMIKTFDKNQDGVISYEEFADWLTNPTSSQTIAKDGWLTDLDMRELLKPLFQVFDRDASGRIWRPEFEECYGMMKNSLRLHPLSKEDSWFADTDHALKEADAESSGYVTLEEFVTWQVKLLEGSGVPLFHMKQLVVEITEAMRDVLDIDRRAQEGDLSQDVLTVLEGSVARLAEACRELYMPKKDAVLQARGTLRSGLILPIDFESAVKISVEGVSAKEWRESICEQDLQLLLRTLAKDCGLLLKGATRSEPQRRTSTSSRRRKKRTATRLNQAVGSILQCIPSKIDSRVTWIAQVERFDLVTGSQALLYFELVKPGIIPGKNFASWQQLENSSKFDAAGALLTTDLKLLAMLQAESFMAPEIRWPSLQEVLDRARSLELIDEEDVEDFNNYMFDQVLERLKNSVAGVELLEMGKDLEPFAEAELDKLSVRPLHAVAGLLELGMVRTNTSDVMHELLSS